MRLVIKLLVSLCIIAFCTQLGRKGGSLAGLIVVMPLTGLLVLVWRYLDNPGDSAAMIDYTRGALWGIIPSMLFFGVAFLCFRSEKPLWLVLGASFAVWLAAAFVHQWLLR